MGAWGFYDYPTEPPTDDLDDYYAEQESLDERAEQESDDEWTWEDGSIYEEWCRQDFAPDETESIDVGDWGAWTYGEVPSP